MVFWINRGSLMKIHIICEGPTDKKILEKIVEIIIGNSIEFIEPSNTQHKNRGVSSIEKPHILNKFLHHSFQKRADCIIICRDNDDGEISSDGVPAYFCEVEQIYSSFVSKYSNGYDCKPDSCIVVPVQTIDYWMLGGIMSKSGAGPATLKGIEKFEKQGIKVKVYGSENLNQIGAPYEQVFNNKLREAIDTSTVNHALLHLPSYARFHEKLSALRS